MSFEVEKKRSGGMQQVEQRSLLHARPANGVVEANHWECLQVWHAWEDSHASREAAFFERCEHAHWEFGNSCVDDAWFQGWQPYVSMEEQFDSPFIAHEFSNHDIQLGVDRQNSRVLEFACSAWKGHMGAAGQTRTPNGPSGPTEPTSTSGQAPSSSMSEQLGETASHGTCFTSAQVGNEDQGKDDDPPLMKDNERTHATMCGAFDSKLLKERSGMDACNKEDGPASSLAGEGADGAPAQSGQVSLDLLLTGPWRPSHTAREAT